jgi:hypothetical protein
MSWSEITACPAVRGDQPSEIIPGLFLSGHPARFIKKGVAIGHPSRYLLEEHNIRLIVNCCAGKSSAMHCTENVDDGTVTTYATLEAFSDALTNILRPSTNIVAKVNIPAVDDELFDLHAFFPVSSRIIALAHQCLGLGVLVHCQMGISRSAAVLAAYLLTRFAGTARGGDDAAVPTGPAPSAATVTATAATATADGAGTEEGDFPEMDSLDMAAESASAGPGVGLWDVLVVMRRRRSCADPNLGFVRQLQRWEAAARAALTAPTAAAEGSDPSD